MSLIQTINEANSNDLEGVAADIRERILSVVSTNGGHLSSSLGAVDLIVAMHRVFDAEEDPFIYDVSHQAYAHKLITDRWESFQGLRQYDGISGFTKPKESPYDYFVAGHSSTSISVAVGAAKAIALKGESRVPVVLIGDGSMSAGMVYEAMNELGEHKYPMVIIINDNEMSIAKPIGAISRYLSKILSGRFYQTMKDRTQKVLDHMPDSFSYMAKKFDESLKLITPGILFEELGLDYIGPVDGHDIESLVEVLEQAKSIGKPVVVHAQTTKGKGYETAEGKHEKWHGVSPFDPETGEPKKRTARPNATKIFSDTLLEMAIKDPKIVGCTAAMPGGTGLTPLIDHFPERFWDVAIAEQHAVTSMAALAKEGFKPFCTLYSTFLQRGFDQVIHDVAIGNLPVIFAIDRAGIVGEDGETHQGLFDVSYLRMIPNMVLYAPRDEETLEHAIRYAPTLNAPCAFRYPRGNFEPHETFAVSEFEYGKAQMLQEGEGDVLFIGYGNGVGRAKAAADILTKEGQKKPALLDLRFVKPIDTEALKEAAIRYKKWFIFSDSIKAGGVGAAVMEALSDHSLFGIEVVSFEFDDVFLPYGSTQDVEEHFRLRPEQLAKRVVEHLI